MRFLLPLLVLALLVAACAPTPLELPPPSDEQPAPQEEPAAPEAAAPAAPEEEPAAPEMASDALPFFAGLADLEYQVNYDMKSNANGQKFSGKLHQFIKGKDLLRMDMTVQGMNTRTILKDKKYYSCNDAQGSWMCIAIDMKDVKSDSDKVQDDIASDPSKYTYRKLPSKTIAGVVTSCWAVTVEQSEVQYCFSPDGVPLYINVDGKSDGVVFTSEMTATSYSKTVLASDFALPAEPGAAFNPGAQDYGDLMKQYGG